MEKRSIYNMVISILNTFLCFVFGILGIVFQGVRHNPLAVVFLSIFYFFMIIHFIFDSISFGLNESKAKNINYRFSKIFSDIATTLVLIYFILIYPSMTKWIFFGFVLFHLLFEIILDSIGKLKEIKYYLSFFKASLFLFVLVYNFQDIILFMGCYAIILYYLSNTVGEILQNKIIWSFTIFSVFLFGMFLLFI